MSSPPTALRDSVRSRAATAIPTAVLPATPMPNMLTAYAPSPTPSPKLIRPRHNRHSSETQCKLRSHRSRKPCFDGPADPAQALPHEPQPCSQDDKRPLLNHSAEEKQ